MGNLVAVSGRYACDMSKVSECYIEIVLNLHSGIEIFFANLHKYSPLWNSAKFDCSAWI